MKKLVILLGILLSTASSFAQFEYGAKVGANASYLINSELDIKPGLAAGGFVYYKLNKTFSFGAELMYSGQGVQISETGRFPNSDNEPVSADYYKAYKLHYLNIPFITKVNVYKGFYTELGFQMGWLLNGTYEIDVEGMDYRDETVNLKEYKDLNKLDLGMNFGLGYEHKSGFLVDVRYNLGFRNTFTNEDQNYLNSVVQTTVGYKFGKAKKVQKIEE